jgi:hypothetical protein
MPALTRRRSTDAREECWHVYYGEVHVGTIAIRSGIPHDQDRAGFEAAWAVFLSKRTEADFEAWRYARDWHAEKYRRFDRGERMPHDWKPISRRASG